MLSVTAISGAIVKLLGLHLCLRLNCIEKNCSLFSLVICILHHCSVNLNFHVTFLEVGTSHFVSLVFLDGPDCAADCGWPQDITCIAALCRPQDALAAFDVQWYLVWHFQWHISIGTTDLFPLWVVTWWRCWQLFVHPLIYKWLYFCSVV